MACTAKEIVKQMESWIGRKESDGSHKKIIDIYNSHTPRARGYKLKYTDAWCAGTVSAAAIACKATDICPIEVGCGKMIDLAKKMGIWVENENCTPEAGWFVFYDWDDDGKGDNKGTPEHVGLCCSVNKSAGTFKVIEGNYSNAVKVRELKINGRYLRGFAKPKYTADTSGASSTSSKSSSTSKSSSKLTVDGNWGKDTTKKSQKILGTVQDGEVSGQLNSCKKYLPNAQATSWKFGSTGKGSAMVKSLQKLVGATVDGFMGKLTVIALQKFLKAKGFYKGSIDGFMGALTVKAWQQYVNSRL